MGHKRKHESKSENELEEKEDKKLKLENKEEGIVILFNIVETMKLIN